MEGFFTKKEVESKTRPDGKSYSCVSCGLNKQCHSPKMQPFGNFKKKILNIGEAPGDLDDKVGKPWQGKQGKLLQKAYEKVGIDLFEDCLNINAVACRPQDKDGYYRNPTNYEVECCRRSVLNVINTHKPKVIVLFGNLAVYSLIGHRWKKDLGGITKWRGWTIPDQDFKAWIVPVFSPNHIEKSDRDGKYKTVEYTIWLQDLKQVVTLLETPFREHKEPKIEIITDLSVLDTITSGEVAFDYETTGIKPHAPGHRIVCCSVATSSNHVYVFMMPETKKELAPFIRLLLNPKVGKIAQNMKFEHAWTKERLKIEVQNWVWDTMIATHIFDNRQSITGLKFQVYVQFGIVDYSSDIAPFLQSDDNGNANAINKIFSLLTKPNGKKKLLTYCGLDSIYEYRLAELQRENILPF